jgi:hypothetical protein
VHAGCARIGTEHLLLTLLDPAPAADDDSSSAQHWCARSLLEHAGLSPATVLVMVEAVYGPGPRPKWPRNGALEASDRARAVLEGAAAIAAGRGVGSTPTDEDILAALVSSAGGVAAAVLDELGATARLRRLQELAPSGRRPESAGADDA